VTIELTDELGEARALAVQLLGMIRVVPGIGLLELTLDFGEAFGASSIVKDTPSGRRGDLADP
jgi:hypothetical protein